MHCDNSKGAQADLLVVWSWSTASLAMQEAVRHSLGSASYHAIELTKPIEVLCTLREAARKRSRKGGGSLQEGTRSVL